MPVFSTQYHDLYYRTIGNSNQPPLLLLHGFLGSYQDFTPITSALAKDFYCIVPDLPGHGKTQSNTYTFPSTANSLLALLDHLNIQQTHLLGYSMGGRLALYLVCEFPSYFLKGVIESASPGLKTAEERAERRKSDRIIASKLQTTPLPSFLSQWYSNPLFASLNHHPNKYETMRQRRENNSPKELCHALEGLGTGKQPSLWKKVKQVQQPLLLIVGTLDTKFVAINHEMKDCLKASSNAQLKIVKGCGHNIHLEAPNLYAHLVKMFLYEQFEPSKTSQKKTSQKKSP